VQAGRPRELLGAFVSLWLEGVRGLVAMPSWRGDMELRFSTDEAEHALVIQDPDGGSQRVGGPGSGAGEFRYPRGLCVRSGPSAEQTRVYVCDAWNHRVQVFDGCGRFVMSFGGLGNRPGQFDVPSDICIVTPSFPGEQYDARTGDAGFLAVADRWNCRVQVFTLDGAFVGSVGRRGRLVAEEEPGAPNVSRAGWPFFHTGRQPALWFPTRIAWRDPYVDVTGSGGRVVPIDLATALLPDFKTWRDIASVSELRSASRQFHRDAGILDSDMLDQIDLALRANVVPLRMAS
jgi:hypothetical protein